MINRVLLAAALFAAPHATASTGVVDRYDCHRDPQTREYHCHGSPENAKRSHVLIGAVSSSDLWLYSNGPYSLFTGAGIQLELAHDFAAVYGNYSFRVHVTGQDFYENSGWEAGIKLGPHISRLGLHPYATAGYFSHAFILPSQYSYDFQGLQYGVGLLWNNEKTGLDLRIQNRNSDALASVWDELGAPGLTHDISIQLSANLRF
jgi:hypothetical protein